MNQMRRLTKGARNMRTLIMMNVADWLPADWLIDKLRDVLFMVEWEDGE